jgi:hypothetical protein
MFKGFLTSLYTSSSIKFNQIQNYQLLPNSLSLSKKFSEFSISSLSRQPIQQSGLVIFFSAFHNFSYHLQTASVNLSLLLQLVFKPFSPALRENYNVLLFLSQPPTSCPHFQVHFTASPCSLSPAASYTSQFITLTIF